MTTQPRMSAPIGRLQIRPSEGRKRCGSGAGRWQPATPPTDAAATEADEARDESGCPRFYPFPLRLTDERDD